MKQTAKLALGAIVAALAVAILFAFSVLPFLEYALPALAGALTMLIVVEVDKKWALGVYIAVTLISLLTVPNKEAAVMYAALFGYYPILKAVFESKLNRALEYICKTALFVSTVLAAYYVMIHFMGMSFDDLGDFGK
ncbi:MAG: hypothetical protein IJL81_00180, partial [Clostridia bacterium]|nr:hypothetical protein [Clostridia bacterium]